MESHFLQQYIDNVLAGVGITDLTDDQKNTYYPQLLAQLEERIGLEFMPKLNPEQLGTFTRMMDNMHTSPEDWEAFWRQSVPDFDTHMGKVLQGFADDVKAAMA